jgi:hypothetical protein
VRRPDADARAHAAGEVSAAIAAARQQEQGGSRREADARRRWGEGVAYEWRDR